MMSSKEVRKFIRSFLLLIYLLTLPLTSEATTVALYPDSYLEAREWFRKESKRVESKFPGSRIVTYKVPSRVDSDLTVDNLYIAPEGESKKLVIISSGIHGVEAYVGTALLIDFLKNTLQRIDRTKTGFLLVHSLNPYGYKYNRRVSENNVDLNRNFPKTQALYEKKNSGYEKLEPFLNPKKPYNEGLITKLSAWYSVIRNLLRHSRNELRQSILQGQYEYEKGLYFGGKNPEPQVEIIKDLLKRFSGPYEEVFSVSIHSGFGERGKLHLLDSGSEDQSTRSSQERIFKGRKIDRGGDENFYKVQGGFNDFLMEYFKNKSVFIPIVFEFGTKDSQTLLGSVESLNIMRWENQSHHYGSKTPEDKAHITDEILDMYFPRDEKWRIGAFETGSKVLRGAIETFCSE